MDSKYAFIFRIVLAGYLAFIGGRILYEMIEERPVNMGAMSFLAVVFMIIGLTYAVHSGKKLWEILKAEKEQKTPGETQELPVINGGAGSEFLRSVAPASETALGEENKRADSDWEASQAEGQESVTKKAGPLPEEGDTAPEKAENGKKAEKEGQTTTKNEMSGNGTSENKTERNETAEDETGDNKTEDNDREER